MEFNAIVSYNYKTSSFNSLSKVESVKYEATNKNLWSVTGPSSDKQKRCLHGLIRIHNNQRDSLERTIEPVSGPVCAKTTRHNEGRDDVDSIFLATSQITKNS